MTKIDFKNITDDDLLELKCRNDECRELYDIYNGKSHKFVKINGVYLLYIRFVN